MVDVETFRELALGFNEVSEEPHFHKVSFRIRKKIFATLDLEKQTAVLKLSSEDQARFAEMNDLIIYAVNGAWGKQGWTVVELNKVEMAVLKESLRQAYLTVAPKSLR